MSNKLVKVEDEFYEEDEISIYDLINIFYSDNNWINNNLSICS